MTLNSTSYPIEDTLHQFMMTLVRVTLESLNMNSPKPSRPYDLRSSSNNDSIQMPLEPLWSFVINAAHSHQNNALITADLSMLFQLQVC